MEQNWTKKRILMLQTGDQEALKQWLDDFAAPIYTWMYYQVTGEAELATEMTGKTLTNAWSQLDRFDPSVDTLYQWLKEIARQTRDDILLHRQTKPQRPWAWSQLSDKLLYSLSTLRSEPLPEEVANNTSIQELVQAALVEMGHAERKLMEHRYNHLDTADHIAEEIGESIEQVNDRLYRSRHSFRRVFTQLIQSENTGFTESGDTGETELLDTNLEKLISATAMYQSIGDLEKKAIYTEVLRTAAANRIEIAASNKPVIWGAVVGVLLLGIIVAAFLISSISKKRAAQPAPETAVNQSDDKTDTKKPAQTSQIDEEELRRVLSYGQSGNLSGLLEILKTGQFESQFAASHFIGELGDESAIGLLEEAEQRWYPNGPIDNAFANAIATIEQRLLDASDVTIEEPDPNEPDTPVIETPKEPKPEPKPPVQAVIGTVTDPEGKEVADARIVLSQNPLTSPSPGRGILARIRTDETGTYRFPQVVDGPVFVDCTMGPRLSLSTRQAVFCERQKSRRVDFGNGVIVSGTLTLDGEAANEEILYLSNAMNPADATFRCETITLSDGRFILPGIPAGAYYLLYNTAENRIVPLQTIDVGQLDTEADINVDYHELTVAYTLKEDELSPIITDVVLTYGPDVSDEFQQYPLVADDEGNYFVSAPKGSYALITRFANDMQIFQDIELTAEQTVTIEIPQGLTTLSGQFTRLSLLPLWLSGNDEKLRFELRPEDNGLYALGMVPAGTYTLGTILNGQTIDFLQIDIQEDQRRQTLDIEPERWFQQFSPLYIIVCDREGNMLTDAQVWLTGGDEVITTRSTGRGAFLAVPAGEYSLHAAYPQLGSTEQVITVTPFPLLTSPNPANTFILKITP
ncbi:MAG: hypothetical protein ACYSUT_05790 [Planctomycetota bacterium]|jgi:RNA polymerase sigma factor (sigma-70 family)